MRIGASLAAAARPAALYAPCLEQHATVPEYAEALSAAGWTSLDEGTARQAALQIVGESYFAARSLPMGFHGTGDVRTYLAAAHDFAARSYGRADYFARENARAMVVLQDPGLGTVHLLCVFAAPVLDEAEELLEAAPDRRTRGALATASLQPPPAPGVSKVRVDLQRIDAPFPAVALIQGRYGIFVMQSFRTGE